MRVKKLEKEVYAMKATGIVRRIDDLGRVVIPKEIRRTSHIAEGDPLEIFTADNGEIILKKYSALLSINESSVELAKILANNAGCPVLISDTDCIVASSRIENGDMVNQLLTRNIRAMIQSQKLYVRENNETLSATNEADLPVFAVIPVAASCDVWGAVILLRPKESRELGEREIGLAQLTADILASQLKD